MSGKEWHNNLQATSFAFALCWICGELWRTDGKKATLRSAVFQLLQPATHLLYGTAEEMVGNCDTQSYVSRGTDSVITLVELTVHPVSRGTPAPSRGLCSLSVSVPRETDSQLPENDPTQTTPLNTTSVLRETDSTITAKGSSV